MKPYITISFKSGAKLEIGEKTLDHYGNDLTLMGHFRAIIEAKEKGATTVYSKGKLFVDLAGVDFIIYIDEENRKE